MRLIDKLLNRPGSNPVQLIAKRFLQAFEAHNIERAHIPRWLPAISYESLQSDQKLLAALTPEILDATTTLFGLCPGWLEGISDLALMTEGERGDARGLLDRVAEAIAASRALGIDRDPSPLRAITATPQLQRQGNDEQWILLVIRQAIGDRGDGPAYRCQVHSYPFDWTIPEERIELKAITRLAHHRLRMPVPLYLVSVQELLNIQEGSTIPEVVFRRPIITRPSLEDYALAQSESFVAKETDELETVLSYLDAQGLRDFDFTLPEVSPAIEQPTPDSIIESTSPTTPIEPRKRAQANAQWELVRSHAKALWAIDPKMDKPTICHRLCLLPDLKLPSRQTDTIWRHLSDLCPNPEARKPGRRPKQSP